MAEARAFRALRYNPALVDPALVIAPPYDVISSDQQRVLYARDPHNIVRIEYGDQRPSDDAAENRYVRAAADLIAWRHSGILTRDDRPAIYRYRLAFDHDSRRYTRDHLFAAVRLEPWEKGVIKPHEHTLAAPKSDRLELLRATRTQVSPVYCQYRPRPGAPPMPDLAGDALYAFEADGQRHELSAVHDKTSTDAVTAHLAASDVYIADGHHRYETALAYRDERLEQATTWTNAEPENFVLMALTRYDDPGLLVLPTHRIVHADPLPEAAGEVTKLFEVEDVDPTTPNMPDGNGPVQFVQHGPAPGHASRLTLRDAAAVEGMMPVGQPEAWRRLDVNVLQYGILQPVFGIDDRVLAAGGAVTYTQDAAEAARAVDEHRASAAYVLRATPVEQLLAVADAGARMPQKSTYFYPKMPTGLVLNPLD